MINNAWEDILGWQKYELVNKHFKEIIHPDDYRHAKNVFQAIMYHGKRADGFIYRCRTRNGAYQPMMWNAVISADGKYGFGTGRVVDRPE